MKLYVGTSVIRAPLLAAIGWSNLAMTASIEEARRQARVASVEDACDGVVMAAYVAGELAGDGITAVEVTPGSLDPVEVTTGDTPEERLGFGETAASVGGIVSGLLSILDQTHSTIRNAIDVGMGANAELPHFSDLKRAANKLRGKNEDDDAQAENDAKDDARFLKSLKQKKVDPKQHAKLLADHQKRRAQKRHDEAIKRLKQGTAKHLNKIHHAVTRSIHKLKRMAGLHPGKTKNKVARPKSGITAPGTQKAPSRQKSTFTSPKTKTTVQHPAATFKTSNTKPHATAKPPRKAKTPVQKTSGPPKGVDAADWWKKLSRKEQIQYLQDHPESLKKQAG